MAHRFNGSTDLLITRWRSLLKWLHKAQLSAFVKLTITKAAIMKKFLIGSVALLVVAMAVHADNIVDEIIARVNDQIITRSDFERAKTNNLQEMKQQYPNDWQARWAKAEKDTLRDLVDRQLLVEKGKELGITGETDTVKRLNQMRQQMGLSSMQELEDEARKQGISFEDYKEQIRIGVVTEQVIGQEVGSKQHITNDEVKEFYDQHQKDMEGPEDINLSEIMIPFEATPEPTPESGKDEKKPAEPSPSIVDDPIKVAQAETQAQQVVKQLKAGAKFSDLAKQVSKGPTAAQGGPLGAFKKGELAPVFEEKTMSLKPGEFTDPIRTRQGFIIFRVNAHHQAGVPPLKEVEEKIKEALYSQKLEPSARAYLTRLREQAYIDIKTGYADTGASGDQSNKPVVLAAAGDPTAHQGKSGLKKKKKFLLF
jgi:peptidyl-prolyl cis-trans isomerase SurA